MKKYFLIFLCFSAISLNIKAQEVIPDTEIGNKIRKMVDLFNSRDSLGLIEFMKKNMSEEYMKKISPEEKGKIQIEIYDDFGVIKPYSYKAKNKNKVKLIVHNRSMTRWLNMNFEFSEKEKNKLNRSYSRLSFKPKSVVIPRLKDNDLIIDIDKFLTELTNKDEFSGTILIAKNGKPFFEKAFGYANIDKKILNNTETKFALGSLNKMMTAIAIAQLHEAGKLNLDDLIIKHLPNYPNEEVAKSVTIHQLLTHKSGLGDVFNEKWESKKDSIKTIKDWFDIFVNEPLLFKPGKKYEYSNAGYVVLGAIIEKISGVDYYTYIREYITMPLGMNNTDFYSKNEIVNNMAEGYIWNKSEKKHQNNINDRPFKGFPAGGGYSTIGDLLKFANAIRDFKLINKSITKLFTTRKGRIIPIYPLGYAYGFMDSNIGGIRTVGHTGGAKGMCASFDIYWESGYTVIVLSNYDPPTAMEIANYIKERIDAK